MSEPEADLVPRREVAERLLDSGLGPEYISSALGIPLPTVRAIATFRSDTSLIPEDRELADEARNLAHRALRKASWYYEFGSTDEVFRITQLVVGRVMALIGAETTTRMEDMKAEFAKLTEDIRGTPTSLDEPEIGAIVAPIDDSDEGLTD